MTSRNKQQRTLVALLTIATAAGAFARAAEGDSVALGTLPLQAEVPIRYPPKPCPDGTPSLFECFSRTGNAVAPGLGTVAESYAYVLENAPAGCTPHPGPTPFDCRRPQPG